MPHPIDSVRSFWDARALDCGLSEDSVTHPDRNQRLLEIDILLERLPRGQRILDVGCGNGFSTSIFARLATYVLGIDYSEAMIDRARREFGELPNVAFQVQDVTSLTLEENSFDVAISQRCLINLPSWESQQKAIANVADVLRHGGYLFLQEGSLQGRDRLNEVRATVGLDRMPTVPYNLDFDEEKLWPFVRRYFDIVEVRRFGIYDLISRVVHPLLVRPAEPRYEAKINEVARHASAKLGGLEDLSREFTAVLRRVGQ